MCQSKAYPLLARKAGDIEEPVLKLSGAVQVLPWLQRVAYFRRKRPLIAFAGLRELTPLDFFFCQELTLGRQKANPSCRLVYHCPDRGGLQP